MATPKPLISPSEHRPTNPDQPPLRIVENPPAKSLAQALANSKAQVDASGKP